MDESTVTTAAVAVGGVAHAPLRLPEVEAALVGRSLGADPSAELLAAAEKAIKRCQPLPQTGYKVELLRDPAGVTMRPQRSAPCDICQGVRRPA